MGNYDAIKQPSHYTEGRKYEPKDVIHDWQLNFNLGSAVKYVARAGRKDDIVQDLKKAQEFIQFEIDAIEAERGKSKNDNVTPDHTEEVKDEFTVDYLASLTADAFIIWLQRNGNKLFGENPKQIVAGNRGYIIERIEEDCYIDTPHKVRIVLEEIRGLEAGKLQKLPNHIKMDLEGYDFKANLIPKWLNKRFMEGK